MQRDKNDGKTGKDRSWNGTIQKWNNKLIIWRRNYISTQNSEKTSTIETKFDKNGNKISMLETSNEVDEEKVTKDNNISLSRDPIASLPPGILENVDKHNI